MAKKTRKKKRKRSAKSHLWIVFAYHAEHGLYYFSVTGVTAPQTNLTSTRPDAVLFKAKSHAKHIAHLVCKIHPNLKCGVASELDSAADIKAAVAGK